MTTDGQMTRLKLEEAKYFLDQLVPNWGKAKKFDFILSAFISAARSVTWVMRAEFSEVAGWREWYDSIEPSQEESFLLRGTTDVRNRAQKSSPLQTVTNLQVSGFKTTEKDLARVTEALARSEVEPLPAYVGGTKGNYFVEIRLEGECLRIPVSTVLFDRRLEEFPDRNIIEVCSAYYGALERLVQQCHEQFVA